MAIGKRTSLKKSDPKTEFEIHVNHLAAKKGADTTNVIDFTERKLSKLAQRTRRASKRGEELNRLLDEYVKGSVSIAWSKGLPFFYSIDL